MVTLYFLLRTPLASPDNQLLHNPFPPSYTFRSDVHISPSFSLYVDRFCIISASCDVSHFGHGVNRPPGDPSPSPRLPARSSAHGMARTSNVALGSAFSAHLRAGLPHLCVNTSRAELYLIQFFISHLPSNVC